MHLLLSWMMNGWSRTTGSQGRWWIGSAKLT